MKSIDKEIDVVIDNHFTQSCFESYVCGFHVYKTVWSPLIGEENLKCRHEENNKEDEFAANWREKKRRMFIPGVKNVSTKGNVR